MFTIDVLIIISHLLAQIQILLVDFAPQYTHTVTHIVNWLSSYWLLTNVMEVLTQS